MENKSDENFDKYENDNYNYQDEEDERKTPPFILLFLFTTVAVLFALGLSFSTINLIQNSDTINSLISKLTDDDDEKYVITYSENTGSNSNGINLVNQFPILDSQGKLFEGDNEVYNFSLIIGEKTAGAYYEFTAVPNATNSLDPSCVKLYLEKNNKGVDFSYRPNGKVKIFTDYQKSENEEAAGVLIYSGKITEEEAQKGRIDFTMRMWISEDAVVDDNFSNKTFGVRVNTYAAFLDR